MTTAHHIYAIKNLMSKGAVSDDFEYSNTLILHFLQQARALLIKDKMRAYETISSTSYQTICLELEDGAFHNCCGVSLPADCLIRKSKLALPEVINYRSSKMTRVLTLNGTSLNRSTLLAKKYQDYNLTGKRKGYFIFNNYLYVLNDDNIKTVLFEAIFVTPEIEELYCKQITNPNGTPQTNCKTLLDGEFPIDADLVIKMYELTIKFLTATDARTRDTGNDSHATDTRGERRA